MHLPLPLLPCAKIKDVKQVTKKIIIILLIYYFFLKHYILINYGNFEIGKLLNISKGVIIFRSEF